MTKKKKKKKKDKRINKCHTRAERMKRFTNTDMKIITKMKLSYAEQKLAKICVYPKSALNLKSKYLASL